MNIDNKRFFFAQILKEYRVKSGIPIDILSAKVNCTPKTIEAIENGKFWPSFKQILMICEALDLDIEIKRKHK